MKDFDLGIAMKPQAEPATIVPEIVEEALPTIPDPSGFDLSPIALSLVPYEQKVKALIIAARDIRVEDDAGRKQATELANVAKKIRLKVEAIKKSPSYLAADAYVKDIRHLCNTLTDPLKNQVENVCKTKLTAYSERLRLAQQRREAEAREEARQLQAKLDAEAKKLKDEAEAKIKAAQEELDRQERTGHVGLADRAALEKTIEEETAAAESIVAPQVVVQAQPQANVVRTDAGASFTTARWVAELVDISLVDRKYLIVDQKVVQKDVDGGMRTIPGFIVKEKLGTSLR